MNSVSIIQLEDLNPHLIRLRSRNPGVTDRGSFIGITYDEKPLYLIIGSKEAPATTPHGVKSHDGWFSLSVDATNNVVEAKLREIDEHLKGTWEAQFPGKQYKPLVYTSGDLSSFSGRVQNVQIVDDSNNDQFYTKEKELVDMVTADSELRVVFKLEHLYFPPHSDEMKIVVKVCKIQLLRKGVHVMDMFEFN